MKDNNKKKQHPTVILSSVVSDSEAIYNQQHRDADTFFKKFFKIVKDYISLRYPHTLSLMMFLTIWYTKPPIIQAMMLMP